MKLPKGVTVTIKGKRWVNEVPDELIPKQLKANLEKKQGKTPEKPKQTEKNTGKK